MTPYQVTMYAKAAGQSAMNPIAALFGDMTGAVGGDDWHTDARFPGKKMRTCKSFSEARKYMGNE